MPWCLSLLESENPVSCVASRMTSLAQRTDLVLLPKNSTFLPSLSSSMSKSSLFAVAASVLSPPVVVADLLPACFPVRQAVKVCDATVRKRLLEFEATPTSQLTVEELNKLPQTVAFPGVEDASAAAGATGGGGGGAGGGESALARGHSGGAGAGATAEKSVLVSDIRMDPPAFIANR